MTIVVLRRLLRLGISLSLLPFAVRAEQRLIPVANAFSNAAQSSSPHDLVRLGSRVLFIADDGQHNQSLWQTDGTTSGTSLLQDLGPNISSSIPGTIGNVAIVRVQRTGGSVSLWRSDGSAAGTYKLMDFAPPAGAGDRYGVGTYSAGARLFLVVSQIGQPTEIWSTDGTIDGTRMAGRYVVESPSLGANGKLYFVSSDAAVGKQLWVSDGTALGTHMIFRAIECPGPSCNLEPRQLFRFGANAGFIVLPDELWTTDGTSGGTKQIATIPGVTPFETSGPFAYFLSNGTVLWRSDGTPAGTREVAAIGGGWFAEPPLLEDGRLILLRSSLTVPAIEVWKSDGTFAGTAKVASAPVGQAIGTLGSRVFLSTSDAEEVGPELWMVDADTGSSGLVRDIDSRSYVGSRPEEGVALNGKYLFPATTIFGKELWQTDGTFGGTTLLANIAPEAVGGIVSGTVRDASTHQPVALAAVRLCQPGGTCQENVVTDANGFYRLESLLAGTYSLIVSNRLYLNKGATVTVQTGFETAGVDFDLDRGGSISGVVRQAKTGAALAQALVQIRDASGSLEDSVYTDLEGHYQSKALRDGVHRAILASPPVARRLVTQVYNGHDCAVASCEGTSGDPIVVAGGNWVKGIDFSLHEYGTIAGTIRDASTNAPISAVSVQFIRSGFVDYSANATSDGEGRYLSPPLAPGSYYVRAIGVGFQPLVYPAGACAVFNCSPLTGTPVTVTVDGALAGVDLALTADGARLTGILRDRAGVPLANVSMWLLGPNGSSDSRVNNVTTLGDGRFTFFGVPAGTYFLKALDELLGAIDCPSFPCSVAGATPIVLAGGKTTVQDMQVRAQQTTISGRIFDAASGRGLPDGRVDVRASPAQSIFASTRTNEAGSYSVTLLSRATGYSVLGSAYGYHSVAFPNVRFDCASSPCPTPVGAAVVPAGTNTNIDLPLARFGAISGTIKDGVTGAPLNNVPVSFFTTAGGYTASARSNAEGLYRWPEANGSYYAQIAQSSHYDAQLYRDKSCPATCDVRGGDLVTVADGGELSSIDFHLRPVGSFGSITGRVVDDATGLGMQGASVQIVGGATKFTDADGRYTFDDIANGPHHLYASSQPPYLRALPGGGSCTDAAACGAAAPVTVAGTTAVDFRLAKLHIASVSPAQGPIAGGTRITINGANFPPQSTVTIGGQSATIVRVTPTLIEAITPVATTAGAAHVTVRASDVTITLAHGFLYGATIRRRVTASP